MASLPAKQIVLDIAEYVKCLLQNLRTSVWIPSTQENKTKPGRVADWHYTDEHSSLPKTQAQQQTPMIPAPGKRRQGAALRLAGQSA